MKKVIMLSLFMAMFSCSDKELEGINEEQQTSESVSVGDPYADFSDINLFPPNLSPDDGGYAAPPSSKSKLAAVTAENFSHVNGVDDTAALQAKINALPASGGVINILAGTYSFQQVQLKSNVTLNFNSGVIINLKGGSGYAFSIGLVKDQPRVDNVNLIGLGSVAARPKFNLEQGPVNSLSRAIQIGYAFNVLIQNFSIIDHKTKGAAIAFNPVQIGSSTNANRCEKVSVVNCGLTGASIGYGLVQVGVGKNITLKNLS